MLDTDANISSPLAVLHMDYTPLVLLLHHNLPVLLDPVKVEHLRRDSELEHKGLEGAHTDFG